MTDTRTTLCNSHVYCRNCEAMRAITLAPANELGIDVTGQFENGTDMLCSECAFVIATTCRPKGLTSLSMRTRSDPMRVALENECEWLTQRREEAFAADYDALARSFEERRALLAEALTENVTCNVSDAPTEAQVNFALGLLDSARKEITPIPGETAALCRAIDEFLSTGVVPSNCDHPECDRTCRLARTARGSQP